MSKDKSCQIEYKIKDGKIYIKDCKILESDITTHSTESEEENA